MEEDKKGELDYVVEWALGGYVKGDYVKDLEIRSYRELDEWIKKRKGEKSEFPEKRMSIIDLQKLWEKKEQEMEEKKKGEPTFLDGYVKDGRLISYRELVEQIREKKREKTEFEKIEEEIEFYVQKLWEEDCQGTLEYQFKKYFPEYATKRV